MASSPTRGPGTTWAPRPATLPGYSAGSPEKKAGRTGLTRDEERQLWAEARAEASAPVMYWDSVFSADKTVSLAHATALAEAAAARRAGAERDAAAWQARADAIEEEFSAAVRTAIGWMQRELAFVRRGSHARRVEGVESGRFEDAQQPPVATFLQHTSRDGDPQLHMHVTWLNRLQAADDGAWLGLDSRALHRIRGAASAIAALAMESRLAGRVGLDDWAYRPASKGRVLASVPDAVIGAFSSRRREIDHVTAGLVAQYRAERGHDPTRRALTSMRQHAAQLTRKGKPEGALDYAQALRGWERVSRTTELGTLRTLARQIWHRGGDAPEPEPLTAEQARAATAAALATLSAEQASFTRADMLRAIAMQLPDHARAADSVATLEDLADRALAGEAGEEVVCLTPAWPPVPEGLTRESDGGSIYRPHGAEKYATASQLSAEERMVCQAQAQGAPKLDRAQAARLLGADARRAGGLHQRRLPDLARAHGHGPAHGPGRGRLSGAGQRGPGGPDGGPGGDRQDARPGRARRRVARGGHGPRDRPDHHLGGPGEPGRRLARTSRGTTWPSSWAMTPSSAARPAARWRSAPMP